MKLISQLTSLKSSDNTKLDGGRYRMKYQFNLKLHIPVEYRVWSPVFASVWQGTREEVFSELHDQLEIRR